MLSLKFQGKENKKKKFIIKGKITKKKKKKLTITRNNNLYFDIKLNWGVWVGFSVIIIIIFDKDFD